MNITTRQEAAAYSENCIREIRKEQQKEPSKIKIKKQMIFLSFIIITVTIAVILLTLPIK